jgi:hypothetical protein
LERRKRDSSLRRCASPPSCHAAGRTTFTSTPFTLVIEQQNGRRFSGTFSSPGSSEPLIAVIARNGTIFAVDEDVFSSGSILAPNRIELCYQQLSAAVRVASCLELTKR